MSLSISTSADGTRTTLKNNNTPGLTLTSTGVEVEQQPTEPKHAVRFQDLSEFGVPIGGVVAFAMQAPPADWMLADGRALSRIAYPILFANLGTAFGAGDGSTTFNIPNLLGVFVRGVDAGRGKDPGRVFGSYQPGTLIIGEDVGNTVNNPIINGQPGRFGGDAVNISEYASGLVGSVAGGDGYFNVNVDHLAHGMVTRPSNVALAYCIRVTNSGGLPDTGIDYVPPVSTSPQVWTAQKPNRTLGGSYTNTTDRSISVSVSIAISAPSTAGTRPRYGVWVGGVRIATQQVGDLNGSNYGEDSQTVCFQVPPGAVYSVSWISGTNNLIIDEWAELR